MNLAAAQKMSFMTSWQCSHEELCACVAETLWTCTIDMPIGHPDFCSSSVPPSRLGHDRFVSNPLQSSSRPNIRHCKAWDANSFIKSETKKTKEALQLLGICTCTPSLKLWRCHRLHILNTIKRSRMTIPADIGNEHVSIKEKSCRPGHKTCVARVHVGAQLANGVNGRTGQQRSPRQQPHSRHTHYYFATRLYSVRFCSSMRQCSTACLLHCHS